MRLPPLHCGQQNGQLNTHEQYWQWRAAIALLSLTGFTALASPSFAQSITAANDGTGTIVTINGNQINIGGGTQAGLNLFQSFQQFGLSQGQIANFLANPTVQNILARVVGGDASVIDGILKVSGANANLYLMNPSGVIFGQNARLDVPASFTATTANAIGVGGGWFNAVGPNDYSSLVGTPNSFAFLTQQPGAIVNAGDLAVNPGQSIALIGGTVVNTGSLTAPGGQVLLTAVTGNQWVKLSQPGMLLSLELQPLPPPLPNSGTAQLPTPLTLPQLLTGGNLGHATGLTVDASGNVLLIGSNQVVPPQAGTAIASGTLSTANASTGQTGGTIGIFGEKVGLVGATINASGAAGGGTVLIGGDYQGTGSLPTAQRTFVSRDSVIQADAWQVGNGGKVILWADENTVYLGRISAQGGVQAGNGGFVEVSGKQNLVFQGQVNTAAPNGQIGTVLLDPTNITISNNPSTIAFTGTVLFADLPADINIDINDLVNVAGDVLLQATNNIDIIIPAGGFNFNFGNNNNSLSFIAGNNINVNASAVGTGGFDFAIRFDTLANPALNLTAQNGNINITGSFSVANRSNQPGVTMNLNAPNGGVFVNNGFLRAGQVNHTTDSVINVTAGRLQITNTPLNGSPGAVGQTARYSIYTFSANANLNSRGRASLQFGNQAPIISGSGGNTLINIRLLQDRNFVVGRTPTTSGVDGQIGIGIASIPPQVLTLLSDQEFTALPDAATNVPVALGQTLQQRSKPGEAVECSLDNQKPMLNVVAVLPTNLNPANTASNPVGQTRAGASPGSPNQNLGNQCPESPATAPSQLQSQIKNTDRQPPASVPSASVPSSTSLLPPVSATVQRSSSGEFVNQLGALNHGALKKDALEKHALENSELENQKNAMGTNDDLELSELEPAEVELGGRAEITVPQISDRAGDLHWVTPTTATTATIPTASPR